MSPAPADTIAELKTWLADRAPEIDDDTDLNDVLEDSLAFIELLVRVETLRGIPIDSALIDLENFRTLTRIRDNFFSVESERT
ncbi:phosphopantetheine-binding protein [Amycolatopsis speibonae]|uniref:Phosphopantetheine-binding protein n=1 Tax=Amycolatopsis speibonae TaxID=1450224 RepID=A0ABV7P3P0_9PSEU